MTKDFLGLGGYKSSDVSSSESGSSDSDDRSVDSAELRAAEAAARLRDYGPSTASSSRPAGNPPAGGLPSVLDAFEEVSGEPDFLHPEATRPLASSRMHGLAGGGPGAGGAAAAAAAQQGRGKKKLPVTEEFDISKLAPPGKGQQQQQADKRGPPGAVIEGKAKRYKQDDGPEAGQQYTAAQIAMMGGNVEQLLDGSSEALGGGKAARGPSTKPMGVTDFLDKGLGGAQLPRKQQDRKDKEKKKRAAGQSTHAQWKSEAEMVLRQQYD